MDGMDCWESMVAQFRAGITMGMVWNRLEMIRNGGSSELGVCARTLELVEEWLTTNVRTFLLDVQTLACSGEWLGIFKSSIAPLKRSNVGMFGCLAWKLLNVRTFETSDVGRLDVKCSNVPLRRSNVWRCWSVGLELSLQEFELSEFDWCLGRFPRPYLLNSLSDFREPYTVGKLIECRIQWYMFRDDRRSENEIMMGINNSEHVLLKTRLLT